MLECHITSLQHYTISYHILLIQSDPISSHSILSHPIPFHRCQLESIHSLSNTSHWITLQSIAIPFLSIPFNSMPICPNPSHPIPPNPTPCHPIPPHSTQFRWLHSNMSNGCPHAIHLIETNARRIQCRAFPINPFPFLPVTFNRSCIIIIITVEYHQCYSTVISMNECCIFQYDVCYNHHALTHMHWFAMHHCHDASCNGLCIIHQS